jgi:uncharacterized cupin superfamily protein
MLDDEGWRHGDDNRYGGWAGFNRMPGRWCSMTATSRRTLWKPDDLAGHQRPFTQTLNPNSYLLRTGLSRLAALQRGKESFACHSHQVEEEWIYILSGRAIAEIDGESHEVGPGDFMAFPPPGVAHLLRNTFDEDVVCLTGGEAVPLDVLDYPTLGKRFLVRYGPGVPDFHELGAATKPFALAEAPAQS